MRVEIAVLRRCTWQGDLRQAMAAMTTGSGTSLVPGVRRLSWLMGGGSAVECGPAEGILGRELGRGYLWAGTALSSGSGSLTPRAGCMVTELSSLSSLPQAGPSFEKHEEVDGQGS